MADYEDKVLHDVDGIEEYDNPLPGWWLITWYVAIIFSIFYMGYYALNFGGSLYSEYRADLINEMADIQTYYAKNPITPPSDDALLANATKADVLAMGKARFIKTCASCHGDQAQGLIGPNLTDTHWIHGGKVSDVFQTIVKGVPAKGMPTWGRTIPLEEISALVSYIRSVQGSNPPDAKTAEGDVFEPQPLPSGQPAAEQPEAPADPNAQQ